MAVGGTGVALGGTGVAVGGTGVAVGGTGAAFGGTAGALGGTAVAGGGARVAVGGATVTVGGTGRAVGGTFVAVAARSERAVAVAVRRTRVGLGVTVVVPSGPHALSSRLAITSPHTAFFPIVPEPIMAESIMPNPLDDHALFEFFDGGLQRSHRLIADLLLRHNVTQDLRVR